MGALSSFLFNPGLAIGTAAIASPILIHILFRRRYRRIRWAAVEFLLDAQRRTKRRVRLEQFLLLLIRCLAVFLVALMITRPFVRPSMAAALLGSAPRTERLIVLDDSASTGYRGTGENDPGGESVFDSARHVTEQLAQWIGAESPDDSLTLLRTSAPRAPSISLPTLSEENLRALHDQLAAMQPSQLPARIDQALLAAAKLVGSSPTQVNTSIYVVSDFQRRDWIRPRREGETETASVAAPLAGIGGAADRVRLTLIDVGRDQPANVAITDLSPLQPQCIAGVPSRFEAVVSNFSSGTLKDVELNVSISRHDPTPTDAALATAGPPGLALPPIRAPRILPGQTVREPIEVTFPLHGSDFIQVSLASPVALNDGLALDNVRSASVDVVAAVRVLLVDGEPSRDAYRDEVYLLKTALRPLGRVASGIDVTVTEEDQLEGVDLGEFHCIVLANPVRLGDVACRNLRTFVQGGGGLIVFAGDQTEVDVYNRRLGTGPEGLLPTPLTEIVKTARSSEAVGFGEWNVSEPMLRAFVDDLATVLRQVQIFGYVACEDPAASPAEAAEHELAEPEPGVARATTSSAPSDRPERPPAIVVARLSDAHRTPLIVRRPFGLGSVLYVGTSADMDWNDWGGNFSYVPIMLEMVQHMSRRALSPIETAVGSSLVSPIDVSAYRLGAMLRTPDYPVDPEIPLQAAAAATGGMELREDHVDHAGVYRFILTTATGETVDRFAAVNPDPGESDLTRATPDELAGALVEMRPEYVRDTSVFTASASTARREMWWPLLMAALAAFMTEHVLAWWFGNRGTRPAGVTVSA